MRSDTFYLTTAIAYTSAKPHIGNTYEIVLADAIARYMRLIGRDVYFQTGTDEHGQKIENYAKQARMDPQSYVDKVAGEVKAIWDMMGASYDKFVRTTDKTHQKKVAKIFKKLYEQGDIYKGYYEGLYCTPCESFFTQSQVVDGKCPDCGAPVAPAKEEAYFFKLKKYEKRLIDYITKENPDFIQPESRKNEMLSNFLSVGLEDLCVSRTSFQWGIPVEFDPGHVIYVWIDALSNYITFLGYDPDGNHDEMYRHYWPADVHLIGKDILRFHTIYWPIMLMALGEPLPKKVFGHPWVLVSEGKMSKSKGNVIYADTLVKHFGVDSVRYYLLHEIPFAQDGAISYELIIERINSDLVNILGNLVNRTLAMTKKYFGGQIPSPQGYTALDEEIIALTKTTRENADEKMQQLKVCDALSSIFTLLRRLNKYIDETTPWILAKDEAQTKRLQTVLYVLLEAIRQCAVLLGPFIPETSEKILDMLATRQRTYDTLGSFGALEENAVLPQSSILFERIDEKEKLEQIQAELQNDEPKATYQTQKPTITIEDFDKIDLRVGKIIEAKKHPKADKLLVLKVDLGYEVRQIVSGIAAQYVPEALIGRTVSVVANLAAIKLRGVESQGMLLMAQDENTLHCISTDEECKPGSPIS